MIKKKCENPNLLKLLLVVAIIGITIIVFSNSINNGFTNWDDPALIINNKEIRSLSFDNIKNMFNPLKGGTYQPVRVLSYAIDFYFFGLNPHGYHIQNILFHTLASVFLFLTLISAIPQIKGMEKLDDNTAMAMAFVTAMLFAVHPINVESVVWLSGRKYVLLSFFLFLSFYFFLKGSENGEYHFFSSALSLFFAVLAVLSSPFGVAIPALFFLFEYCRNDEINPFTVLKKKIKYFIPYIALCLVLFPLLFMKLVRFGQGGLSKFYLKGKPLSLIWIILYCLFDYARNLFVPLWLNCRYPDYMWTSPWHYKILIAIICLVLIIMFLVKQLKHGSKKYIFPFLWFVIAWLPASNIIPISTKMADRYIYIAGVGFFIFVSFLLFRPYKRLVILNKKSVKAGIFIFVLFCLCILTWQRNKVWKNSFTLWEDSLQKYPYNFLALTDLGSAYFKEGAYKKAIKYYYAAALINPEHFAVHHNLGAAYMQAGQFKKAEKEYLLDIKINPNSILSHEMLAEIYQKLGEKNKALLMYNKLVQLSGGKAKIYYDIANLFADQGKFDKAIIYFNKALKKRPDYPEAEYNLGRAFHALGQLDKAEKCYLKAIRLKKNYPEPYNNLGNIMLQKGKYDEANKFYKKALELRKNYPQVYYNMGNACVLQGKYKEALKFYKKAIKIDPDYSPPLIMIKKIEKSLFKTK